MVQRGTIKEDFGWYEAGLPLGERKKRGHFSTPPLLVERILDACGYTPAADLTHLRVLDPACGSGNFLAGAARRLLAFGERTDLPRKERISLVECNLWGFDPDPVSCFLAEMQLQAVAKADLQCDPSTLHIHQADSLVLPWEPCVDLFVANPPYLAARNNDLSGYRNVQGRGQADSYLLFLNLALQIVRPGGWIGLVLPDPLLARVNAAKERARLLEGVMLHHLWHLGGVFAADVGAVVIIAQKCPPRSTHHVLWIRERWSEVERTQPGRPGNSIPQSVFLRQPGAEFRYLLSSERGAEIERLRACLDDSSSGNKHLAPLEEFLSICRGEELGKESPWLVEMTGQSSAPTLGREQARQPGAGRPVLRGGIDIHPYSISHARWQIVRNAIVKPLERYVSPKLLIVKSTDRLQAALDLRGHVTLQTLYLLHLRDKSSGEELPIRPDEREALAANERRQSCLGGRQPAEQEEEALYFFLALLNSQLLRDYVYILHTAYKWVQPQIEQRVLARLPIPVVGQDQRQQVIERAKDLVSACSKSGAVVEWDQDIIRLYEEQERAICALYNSVLPGLFGDKGVILNG
jgi:type I restriction-modification system DNA methylase subunit